MSGGAFFSFTEETQLENLYSQSSRVMQHSSNSPHLTPASIHGHPFDDHRWGCHCHPEVRLGSAPRAYSGEIGSDMARFNLRGLPPRRALRQGAAPPRPVWYLSGSGFRRPSGGLVARLGDDDIPRKGVDPACISISIVVVVIIVVDDDNGKRTVAPPPLPRCGDPVCPGAAGGRGNGNHEDSRREPRVGGGGGDLGKPRLTGARGQTYVRRDVYRDFPPAYPFLSPEKSAR